MRSTGRCSRCGTPLSDRTEGLCPACLLQLGLDADGAGETRLGTPAPGGNATTVLGTPAPAPAAADAATRLGPPTPAPSATTASVHDRYAGERIGPYRLVRILGEGGMGVVYLAEQEEPIRRTVALKLIKLGMDTREVVGRFEAERQTLALMDHPNIASVLDAGATADGRPYFVMEYAPGVPITEYCDAHELDTAARLQLFITVCGAVQHAHQKGTIHRDLKPSNVLVVEQDGQPMPKVIDFGIAKATDQRMAERTQFTQHGLLIGTPEYMSPEQTDPTTADLDTRTDIYALGVVLYELLVGGLPFPPTRLREAGYTELLRIIREEEPARPSARLTALGATATDVAGRRHTKLPTLAQQLRGDLDWITLKALEKDRARRYSSASELAADLTRYLQCEPVVARPPSVRYRVGKFVRRNRIGVTAAALVLIAVVGGLVVSSVLFVREGRARRDAVAERDRADEATQTAVASADAERRQRTIAESATLAETQSRTRADEQTVIARQALSEAETNLYFNNIALIEREVAANNLEHAHKLLDMCPPRLRNWEWHYLWGASHMEGWRLTVPGAGVRALGISVDGTRLLAATNDFKMVAWNAKTREIAGTMQFGDAKTYLGSPLKRSLLHISANGATIAGGVVASAFLQDVRELHIWDAATGRERFTRTGQFTALGLSADGSRLLAGSVGYDKASGKLANFALELLDVESGRPVVGPVAMDAEIRALRFTRDGSRVAVAIGGHYDDQEIRILDAATLRPVATLKHAAALGSVDSLDVSADGAWVAAGVSRPSEAIHSVKLWATADGREFWTSRVADTVTSLVIDPTSSVVVAAVNDRTLRVLDRTTGRERQRLAGHTASIDALLFTPDGLIASAGADGTVRSWAVATVRPTVALEPPQNRGIGGVDVDVDRRLVLALTFPAPAVPAAPSGSAPGTSRGNAAALDHLAKSTIEVWDAETGRRRTGLSFPENRWWWGVNAGQMTRAGARIAMPEMTFLDAGRDRVVTKYGIRVLDLPSGASVAHMEEPRIGVALPGQPATPPAHVDMAMPNDLAFDPAGARVAIVTTHVSLEKGQPVGEPSDDVDVWDIATRQRRATIRTLPGVHVRKVALSANRRRLALVMQAERSGSPAVRTLGIYELPSGRLLRTLPGFDYSGRRPVFTTDGRLIAALSTSNAITVWDAETGRTQFVLPGNNVRIVDVAFSPDGRRLISTTIDGSVILRHSSSGEPILALRASGGAFETRELTLPGAGSFMTAPVARFSADGRTIVLFTTEPVPQQSLARIRIHTWTGSEVQK